MVISNITSHLAVTYSEKTIPYHNQEQVSKSAYTEFNPRVDKPH